MQSILELEISQRKLRTRKRTQKIQIDHQILKKEDHSRSRNKKGQRKSKSKKKSKKRAQVKQQQDKELLTCASSVNKVQKQEPSEPLEIEIFDKNEKSNQYLELQCAKLVQANAILSHIISQTACQKYRLQQKICNTIAHLDKLMKADISQHPKSTFSVK